MKDIVRGARYCLEFHKRVNFGTLDLFNMFICDMFYFLKDFDIANYVDDSTPYCTGKSAEFVVNNLEQSSTILFE